METIIGLIIFGAIWFVLVKVPDIKFNNYMPPEGMMIDYNKQSLDRIQNHLTIEQVKANTVAGKYNVKR